MTAPRHAARRAGRRDPTAHPREFELDAWGWCSACGERHGSEQPERKLTPAEEDALARTGELPAGVRWVPDTFPATYGKRQGPISAPRFIHPDGRTSHLHQAEVPGECPFCRGEEFAALVTSVQEGTIGTSVQCEREFHKDRSCAWCLDEEPTCACGCHARPPIT